MPQLLPPFERFTDGLTGKAGPVLNFAMVWRGRHTIARFMYKDAAFDALLQVVIVEPIALVAYVASTWELRTCTIRHVQAWGI